MRCIFLSILLLFRDVIARRLFVFLFVCSVSVSLSHDIIRSLVGWMVGSSVSWLVELHCARLTLKY